LSNKLKWNDKKHSRIHTADDRIEQCA